MDLGLPPGTVAPGRVDLSAVYSGLGDAGGTVYILCGAGFNADFILFSAGSGLAVGRSVRNRLRVHCPDAAQYRQRPAGHCLPGYSAGQLK